jgi:glucan phosphoethanolaminetransferase (alkaline phosphatase superfamily)
VNAEPRNEPLWYPYRGIALLAVLVISAIVAIRWWRRRPRLVSMASRGLVALVVMWVFSVQTWGYIANWEGHFTFEQFVALNVLPPIGAVFALWLWQWARRGQQ